MLKGTSLSAFLSDSEALKSGSIVATGLYLTTTLNNPMHVIIIFALCVLLGISYEWARTWKKRAEIMAGIVETDGEAKVPSAKELELAAAKDEMQSVLKALKEKSDV